MAKMPRPRVFPKHQLDVSAFPDEVTVAMREITESAKQGLSCSLIADGVRTVGVSS